MRDDLRRTCSAIWVIDCSPEGHQPDVPTRIFEGVQQPVCIVLATRRLGKDPSIPAKLSLRSLTIGRREEKFEALASLSLTGTGWTEGPSGWREPFLPERHGIWADFMALDDLFRSTSPGVLAGRTWVIAPDKQTLKIRWNRLIGEANSEKKEELFFPTLRHGKLADRHTKKTISEGLHGFAHRATTIANESGSISEPIRIGYRSFDRQWLIPDNRLLLSARPNLWATQSDKQVHLTALVRTSPKTGPALTVTGLIPDYDHYKGSFAGRAFSLWRDSAATVPNIKPALLERLAKALGAPVTPEDVMAYIAAVLAHPAFAARYKADLVRPGLRLPLTADKALFDEAAALGREVVWLHCYGERFVDTAAGRPKGPPRLPPNETPSIPAAGAIPGAPEPLPEAMDYDAAKRRLVIGKGFVENVTPAMRNYEVSGKTVLDQWFSYRRRDRTRPMIGDRRPSSQLEKDPARGLAR